MLGLAELEHYEREGYVVFDPGVPEELIDSIRSDTESLYRFEGEPNELDRGVSFGTGPRPRIMDAWKIVDSVRALALAPRVLAVTEQIFGRRPLPFQTLSFSVGTQQPPHMDSMAFYSDPPDYMCGVWVALEDMDMENGPLVYYPGSHKLVRPAPWEEIGRRLGKYVRRQDYPDHSSFMEDRLAQWHEYCGTLIEEHGLEPAYGTINKGQALLWAPNLLHGGSPQRDDQRTRHSQVTHYFFEGCRHYSPVRTEGEHIFWDYKEWVREPPPEYGTEAVQEAIKEHVPGGATVLIAVLDERESELLEVEGFDVRSFNVAGTNGDSAVDEVERARSEGAVCAVFPKPTLAWLVWELPELQSHLESEHRALLRDGAICAIYALD
jgi:ectoine hydroxylase-related dioxygenase (phytanoyl-CoA dioxygenase family)